MMEDQIKVINERLDLLEDIVHNEMKNAVEGMGSLIIKELALIKALITTCIDNNVITDEQLSANVKKENNEIGEMLEKENPDTESSDTQESDTAN